MLAVSRDTLAAHGAVSEAVAREMALGALRAQPRRRERGRHRHRRARTAARAGKPVGLVWFAWAHRGGPVQCRRFVFAGDREAVRRQSVAVALQGLVDLIG